MLRITLEPVGNLDALGQRWRALEADTDAGFFRSWTFLGCQAEDRFAGARLLAATQDGCDVALGLLGQAGGRFWLNQTGRPAQDGSFIEHNGLLAGPLNCGAVQAALGHAVRQGGTLVLAGVGDATLEAAGRVGWLSAVQSRLSPCVDLQKVGGRYLGTLSANARAQIRRSMRLYGPGLALHRAGTVTQALEWFAEMVRLHQASWQRRGLPGAFGDAAMRRFHAALVSRAWPLGEADLLRIEAGGRVVGLLYTLLRDGRVLSYQSGFDYDLDRPREKPGLVCHTLAIEHYAARGARTYDFLAGADRYKLTLAPHGKMLHWATLHRPWSAAGLLALGRRAASKAKALIVTRP